MKKKFFRLIAGMLAVIMVAMCGIGEMPEVQAANAQMTIVACQINPDLTTVTVIGSSAALPASDDGVMYLFAEPTYSGGITTNYIAAQPMATTVTFVTELLQGQTNSRLYSKFVIATLQNGVFVPVSNFCYLINPEILATHTAPRTVTTSKKGLIPDPARLSTGELADLGVQHISYNIPVANLLGPTTNASYPTINYTYNGKTYQFNGLAVAEYDGIFRQMQNQNICVTAVLLNNLNPNYAFLVHPLALDGTVATYYAFNAADPLGTEYLAAIGSFLASRYSGGSKGKVDNWIIGNEVPARTQWNYIQSMSVDAYAAEYAKALRIFYTAIRSENANARVYTSVDQVWDTNKNYSFRYDAKDFLTSLNNYISAQGNIAWGVSCHPYPVPLTFAPWWIGGKYYRNLVKHNANSPYVTMENIEVLTDFMCNAAMLTPSGNVRPIIINEVGYTSAQGEAYQAAAFTYGYLQAANNQHIDAFIINSQLDHPAEIAQGLLLGIQNMDGSHKLVYDYFKNIDTPNAAPYYAAAAANIGITDWGSVLTPR